MATGTRIVWAAGLAVAALALGPASALGQGATQATPAKAPAVESTLAIGDKAPKLDVVKWVKGEPVDGFKAGTVSVVEFWATWCGPCKVSIPHLTEVAKANPDVRVIGVSIWEDSQDPSPQESDAYLKKVEAFVATMGDAMDYHVAYGGVDDDARRPGKNTMARTWMRPANQNGIPAAFIVGKKGTIEWIGHPLSPGFDAALSEIKAGTYDSKAAAARAAKEQELSRTERRLARQLRDARESGDARGAAALADQIMELSPSAFGRYATLKFRVLLLDAKDADGAYGYARSLLQGAYAQDPQTLNSVAWTIVDDKDIEPRNLEVAMLLAERADEASDRKDPMIIDTLARVHFEKKDLPKAIEVQTRAISSLEERHGDAARAELTATLERYKAAAGG